eukprot:gb/GECG01015645.1/.p1 GENE.gb/GECG01015645.1/~~gb/GECG01015645.1/.p1  ORF type:complete len:516 (+),score=55.07 gb/GECG01015645.1/:1-1548(+)
MMMRIALLCGRGRSRTVGGVRRQSSSIRSAVIPPMALSLPRVVPWGVTNERRRCMSTTGTGSSNSSSSGAFLSEQTFRDIGVTEKLTKKLRKLGFVRPSSIQASAIPPVREGQNVIINAETGSGKTLAYTLPLLEKLQGNSTMPLVCILVPSQELCSQIHQVIQILDPSSKPLSIYRGSKISPKQVGQHKVLVATPSALENKMSKPVFRELLDNVKYFVLDEADILLSATFQKSAKQLVSMAGRAYSNEKDVAKKVRSPHVQYIFCAATMLDKNHKKVGQWLDENFFDAIHCRTPRLHMLSPNLKVNNIRIDVDSVLGNEEQLRGYSPDEVIVDAQLESLLRALKISGLGTDASTYQETGGKTLVFASSFPMCEAAADYLHLHAPELKSAPLHKEIPKEIREKTVKEFLEGTLDVLISTDLMSRGIDTSRVEHVIQLECPDDLPSYIHRCGRTARAGRGGIVTNIIPSTEDEYMSQLQNSAAVGLEDTFSRTRNARYKQRRLKKKTSRRQAFNSS